MDHALVERSKGQLAISLTVPDVHFISLQSALHGLSMPSNFCGFVADEKSLAS
jgi:hypothetical protein